MNLAQVFLLLSGGSLPLGIFLATFLMTRGGRERRSQQVLGLLILACALNAAHPVLGSLFTFHSHGGRQFFEPLQFLLAPLTTAYAASLLHGGLRWRPAYILHFLPCLGAGAVALAATLRGNPSWGVTVGLWTALAVQMVCYLVPAIRILRRYQRSLLSRVSNLAPVDLDWLRWFYVVLVALCLVAWGVLVMVLHHHSRAGLAYGVSLAMTGAVWVLGFRGLAQKVPETPETSETPETDEEGAGDAPASGTIETPGRIETSGTNETSERNETSRGSGSLADGPRLREIVVQVLERQKPYLEPDLGLDDLARLVAMPRNQLSAVINDELGMNFYDLVNGYRVQEFRKLLADPARQGAKLLTLAFAAGFNSKPTFNKVVRKHTGSTPSQLKAATIESRPSR